ncbi:MAG: peptidase S16 lon-like protein [Comamonadaceae bacterium]|nr:MAG: peptidase S16 lon-like protein [Comamonadaceae bacterium]
MMEPQITSASLMSEALTLQSLPLFPLGTVLYPAGYLPLQIFEVRYLDMVGKCFKAGAPFGVVTLNRGSEVRQALNATDPDNQPQELFYPTGTLARITSLSRPQPGLMLIQCTGLQRFEVSQHELLKHGLWVANVNVLPDDQRIPIPEDLLPVAKTLERVIATLQAQGTTADQMPMQPPYQLDDCAWVANRWCELLPMPLELKNRLMSLDNPLVRLELVGDLLERNGIST